MTNRLKALRIRHDILDAKIDREQTALRPDGFRITALKKIRLKIRDEIAALERAFAMTAAGASALRYATVRRART